MDKENEDFWNGSVISDRKENFFDSNVGSCLSKDKRIFESEIETLENYVEKPASGSNFSFPVSFEPHATEDMSTTYAELKKRPQTMLSKQEAEINFLKRQLTEVADPSTTVLRIIMGQPYSLEFYKSKEQKLQLLDEALRLHDGNAILIIVLFMQRTLKPSLFNLEMSSRPTAINHYISHLTSEDTLLSQAIDVLSMFNRSGSAAMLRFKQAVSHTDPSSKASSLERCLSSHFRSDPSLQFEASMIQAYINLLQLQLPIQSNDEKTASTNEVLRSIPFPRPLTTTSALSTLYYTCLYHYKDPPTLLSSPRLIKKNQDLTDKQFLWQAMKALVTLKDWIELEGLFVTKNWMGSTKMRSPIDFDRVVSYLHHMDAPLEIKSAYCRLIDDLETRIDTACRTNCHKVVLETYKEQKNKRAIEQYQIGLNPNSPEGYLAAEILSNPFIKWKR